MQIIKQTTCKYSKRQNFCLYSITSVFNVVIVPVDKKTDS